MRGEGVSKEAVPRDGLSAENAPGSAGAAGVYGTKSQDWSRSRDKEEVREAR